MPAGNQIDANHILLFDGVCNLCNNTVNFVIRRDPEAKFKFAALQSDAAKKILERFGLSSSELKTFVFISNGKYYLKSSAILHVFKEMKGGWKLLYSLIIIPAFLRNFFYNIISKSRYKIFGKLNACMIPGPGIEDRFLH